MVERLLPSDDPVAEEVLEWTIKRVNGVACRNHCKEGSGDAHKPCIGFNGRD